MPTVLTPEGVVEVDARFDGDRVLVTPEVVSAVLGWTLQPEGLCRGDVCVPVRADAGVRQGAAVDLAAAAMLVGSRVLVDAESEVVAVSVPADRRREALTGRVAPDFTLPDLDGTLHSLEEFAHRKRLLIAFASW